VPHPASTTISSFIEELIPGKPADRMEMIFILYRAYREVIYRHGGSTQQSQEFAETLDFNKFQRWADIILGDFNDVDMYLVDPAQLFPNLSRYREISANYLDEEVIEEIKRHWRADKIPEFSDVFWNHITHPGNAANRGNGQFMSAAGDAAGNADDSGSDDAAEAENGSAVQFFKLWQVMLELYETFNAHLRKRGLFYPGMAYRNAVEAIKARKRSDFAYKRYIFVGFNMLSKSEETIFRLMQSKPKEQLDDGRFADFYFDNASPAFAVEGNTTAKLLQRYAETFPSLYDCIEPIEGFPKIEITGVASKVGQAKIAGTIVNCLYPKDGDWSTDHLRHTAIILPQESLTQGIIASLPEQISPVNITMGYRLRESKVATLVRNVVSMHLRSRKGVGSRPTFFYEDVINVLTHPLMRQAYPTECSQIIYEININRLYNIDAQNIIDKYPKLSPLFKYVENSGSANEVFDYFECLFQWMLSSWEIPVEQSGYQDAKDNGNANGDNNSGNLNAKDSLNGDAPDGEAVPEIDEDGISLEGAQPIKAGALIDRMLTGAYLRGIARLKRLIAVYLPDKDIYLADTTLFHLLERLVGGETINFEGRPLNGLQVMGVLESRNLDFDNIILPSMNERIFPRKHFQKSFIPPHLRRAYDMATQEHQESIYSYYFYRMISRARRVFLLYDARTQGVVGSGQMSRYLSQLLYLYKPKQISFRILGYQFDSQDELPPYVKKSPEICAELERYRSKEHPRYLSASAINSYINCPLQFYLTYIAGYKREDEFHDYMDESTFGTIVHGILEDLYTQETLQNPHKKFTRPEMESLMKKKATIDNAIVKRINQHYMRLGENCLTPLKGDAEIFRNIITQYMQHVLQRDMEAGTFEFVAGEFGGPMRLRLCGTNPELAQEINFTYSIDRVDHLYNADGSFVKRIIDYKTGEDATGIVELSDMFQARNSSAVRAKAMLQLFLYAQAYAQQEGYYDAIQPWIYSIRKVATEEFTPLHITDYEDGKRKKVDIADYRDYQLEFNDLMLDVLSDFFNPEIPFEAATDDHACTYCKFTEICRKKPS
jgi:hypothetical protein